ncbi:uncharacterized protein LOC118197963 isoform X2 [Stegodyphus dumicola]|uniref:uncharacterized protein LOC118197963 isoform X2 n=1 Tax=Stegodyphus dumicola TaxID=202533 RepID=UPI0015AEEB70|nr:uncharacterized protein LOC118197963 isoform X2 [Stegodyphus dumicola]
MDYVEEAELLVYDEAEYASMNPTKAIYDRGDTQNLIVTFSGGKVPPLPLICVISGEGWPLDKRLAASEINTLDTCAIPYPSSMKLNVAQSFNGIHTFRKVFELRFYASPPEMRKYYIAEDGHAVVIVFDRPVNLCNLQYCSQILNSETLTRLGEGADCQWATKQQLIITVQDPIQENPFRVTFKKGVLKQDGERYALPKNDSLTIDAWYPQPVSSAQVAISGPSTVPYCGFFTLVGHFSSPKGDAAYYWTAYRADNRPIDTEIADALLHIRSASLTLNASLLEVDLNYTFILTAEHPVNEKYEARHDVCRKSYAGPFVTAFSDVMTESSISVDQRVTLQADVTIPECSTETEVLHVMWSVNNPKVKFDFKSRDSQMYRVEPFTLPENTEVIFTAHAYFANFLNVTTSRVVLRVEPLKLKAMIKGAGKRVVGNKDGFLVLESEVINVGIPLIYQWKCYEQNLPICYNYKRNSTEPLLLPRQLQNKPKLKIPCDSLKAGQTLTFELQVFNANNRYQYSPVASTIIVVEDKNIPQVTIDSVVADGPGTIQRHPTTGAYPIPAGLPVAVYATVKTVKSALKTIKWEIKGYSTSFTYTSINGKTILSLEEGFLVGHGIYLIGLSACDNKGACGTANLTIHAIPGIALCKLKTKPYVEYEQVCDKYMICKIFNGAYVKVTLSENKREDRAKLLRKAMKSLQIRDPLNGLSLFLTATLDSKMPLSERETMQMLDAGAKATHNRFISAAQLSLIYSAMLPLLRQDNKDINLKALDVIRRSTRLAFAHKVKIPKAILTQGHSNAAEALQNRNSDSEVSLRVKKTVDMFVEKISASSSLGSRVLLASNNSGFPSTLVFRQLLDRKPISIKAKTNNGEVEGSVRFEESVREKVRKRDCGKASCDDIVVALTLYPEQSPFPISKKKTSPLIDITLRKPEDGKPFEISDMPNGIHLALSHDKNATDTQSKGVVYRCYYWDEDKKLWTLEGLLTSGVDGKLMRCTSSHLTSFAVLETYDGLSTGSIVGIVVTVLMAVFIIMMFVFFFLRKKQAATTRISNEALQPKRNPDKLQGMNGSVVRVKTVTP